MITIKRSAGLIGLLVLFLISQGCAGRQLSRMEMDYGASFKLARFNQILNPGAEKNLEPVSGLDGKAARAAMEKYQKSFEKPEKETGYMFSTGGKK